MGTVREPASLSLIQPVRAERKEAQAAQDSTGQHSTVQHIQECIHALQVVTLDTVRQQQKRPPQLAADSLTREQQALVEYHVALEADKFLGE